MTDLKTYEVLIPATFTGKQMYRIRAVSKEAALEDVRNRGPEFSRGDIVTEEVECHELLTSQVSLKDVYEA